MYKRQFQQRASRSELVLHVLAGEELDALRVVLPQLLYELVVEDEFAAGRTLLEQCASYAGRYRRRCV